MQTASHLKSRTAARRRWSHDSFVFVQSLIFVLLANRRLSIERIEGTLARLRVGSPLTDSELRSRYLFRTVIATTVIATVVVTATVALSRAAARDEGRRVERLGAAPGAVALVAANTVRLGLAYGRRRYPAVPPAAVAV